MAARVTTRPDIYGGRDPRAIPAYSIPEVSRYVKTPTGTLRSWIRGRQPVIVGGADSLLSFWNLVEIFVLSCIRRQHQVPLSAVRRAVRYLRERFQTQRPLADHQMWTDGANLFIDELGRLISASEEGQQYMREVLAIGLSRIDRDMDAMPVRLYPFVAGKPAADAPRVVSIDPRKSFGRPCLAGTGIPADVLVERFRAGDPIREIAADYGVPEEEIEAGIQFAA